MQTSLFDRVASLVEEIGVEKRAAVNEKIARSQGLGKTTHPSDKEDENEQAATEGEQSADNDRRVKETIPDSVTGTSDATEGGAKATDVQQGTDVAKPTGEDPGNESNYKGKLEGDKRVGEQGGTSHPAKGDYGEKYSADRVAQMSNEDLCKAAADLGNEIVADIANGLFSEAKPQTKRAAAAAQSGAQLATQAGETGNQIDKLASEIIQEIVKSAYRQADLVTDHLARELAVLKSAENEDEDPTSGVEDGEDHGTEGVGGEVPPEAAGQLLAAMGGGEGGMPPGAEGGMLPGAEGGMPPLGAEGLPPEAAMAAGGPPPGAEGVGAPPAELGGMGNEAALQQLAMALMEAGIDPRALAAAMPDQGAKIASAVMDYQRSGRFQFSEAKKGSAERKVRDYLKNYVTELYRRSR